MYQLYRNAFLAPEGDLKFDLERMAIAYAISEFPDILLLVADMSDDNKFVSIVYEQQVWRVENE